MKDNQIVSVKKKDFLKIAEKFLDENFITDLKKIESEDLTIPFLKEKQITLLFDARNLYIEVKVPLDLAKAQVFYSRANIPDWVVDPLPPEDFSMIFNYDLQQVYDEELIDNESYLFGRGDLAINFHSWVLEGRVQYDERQGRKWFREQTRLVKDDEKRLIRYILGDLNYPVTSYQNTRDLGGLSISRLFNIDPYRVVTPLNRRDFVLRTRSLVRIFVNNRLVQSDFLDAGKHTIEELPLFDGLNDVTLEITDEFGKKEYIKFTQSSSTELLAKGLDEFNLTVGRSAETTDNIRKYTDDDGTTFSGFYRRGFSDQFSAGVFGQQDRNFSIYGVEALYATAFGNLLAEAAFSSSDQVKSSNALKLTHDLRIFGENFLRHSRLLTSIEFVGETFSQLDSIQTNNRFSQSIRSSLSKALNDLVSIGLGGSYSKARLEVDSDGYGLNASLNFRLNEKYQLNTFAGRSKQADGSFSDSLYINFNMAFAEQNNYINSFYDAENNASRVSFRHQPRQRIDRISPYVVYSDDPNSQRVETGIEYTSSAFELRSDLLNTKVQFQDSTNRARVRLLSSVLATSKGIALSRPVNTSFALIDPNKYLDGQEIAVRSNSIFQDGRSVLGGPAVIPDLRAYQYFQTQIDTSKLDPGYSIGREGFVILPKYRSGHYISVGRPGSVTVIGFLELYGKRLAYKTGLIQKYQSSFSMPFFTNKTGRFVAESLPAGKYRIEVDGIGKSADFVIEEGKAGILKLGELTIR